MNALSQRLKIIIFRAIDDAQMLRIAAMKPQKISAIESQDNAVLCNGKLQNLVVWNSQIGFAGVTSSQHVMPKISQNGNHPQVEVIIGINL